MKSLSRSLPLLLLALIMISACYGCGTGKSNTPAVIVHENNYWDTVTCVELTGSAAMSINARIQAFTKEPNPVFELIGVEGENIGDTKTTVSYENEGNDLANYSYRGYCYNQITVCVYPSDYPFSVSSLKYRINGEEHTAVYDPSLKCEFIGDEAGMDSVRHNDVAVLMSDFFEPLVHESYYTADKDIVVDGFDMKPPAKAKNAQIVAQDEGGRVIVEGGLEELAPVFIPKGTVFNIHFEAEIAEESGIDRYSSGCLLTSLWYTDSETGKSICKLNNLFLSSIGNEEDIKALLDSLLDVPEGE